MSVALKAPAARAATVVASNLSTAPRWPMSGPPLSITSAASASLRRSSSSRAASSGAHVFFNQLGEAGHVKRFFASLR